MEKIQRQEGVIKASSWVNKNNHYFPKIGMEENRIEAIEFDAFVLGGCILGKRFKYSVKIEQMEETISIGVADVQSSVRMNNKYMFYNKEGEFYENSEYVTESQQFQKGDIVSVMGDLSKCFIMFQINGNNTLAHKSIQMNDKSIEWVPYIHLELGTSISIIDSFPQIDAVAVSLVEDWFKWDEDIVYSVYNCIQIVDFQQQKEEEE